MVHGGYVSRLDEVEFRAVAISDSFDDNNYTDNPTWFVLQQDTDGIGLESTGAAPAFAADGSSVGNNAPAAGMLNFSPAAANNKRICLSFTDAAQTTGVEVSFDLFQSDNAYPAYYGFCMELADSYSGQSYLIDGYLTTQYYGSPGGGMSGFRSYDASGTLIGGVAGKSLLNGWRRMVLRFNPGSGVEVRYDGQTVASWPNFKNLTRVDQLILYHTGTISWFVDNVIAGYTPASDLSKGHRILLQKNLQIQGLSFGEPITEFRFKESNLTGINRGFYPANCSIPAEDESIPLPSFIPQWGRRSNNSMQHVLAPPEADPNGIYLSRMVNYQYGEEIDNTNFNNLWHEGKDPNVDEGKVHLEGARTWFNTHRSLCPDVILYTTQWDTQVSEEIMRKYMAVCQPDMVSFDQYYFRGPNPADQNYKIYGGSPKFLYQYLQKYRLLGLGGNDGTGRLPIPCALFFQTFAGSYVDNYTISESEMRLNVFAAWAFGFKFVTSFVYMTPQHDPLTKSVLFDGRYDVSPTTPLFSLFAKMNGESRKLGSALVRLISTDVRMKMGQHYVARTWWERVILGLPTYADNVVPSGVATWSLAADPYITGITATNLGTLNRGYRGDAIIGFFKPLHESFDGDLYRNQKYFMVVNGLTDIVGNAAACRQRIRIDFDFGTSGITSLQRMRRSDGLVEVVPLIADGGSKYHLNLELDGGTGDLFKFNTDAPFVGATSDPVVLLSPGDANSDGKVDVGDLGILAANYGQSDKNWATGDFNNDGLVDVGDLGILAANYGTGTGAPLDFNADAVALGLAVDGTQAAAKEEPASTSVLGCGSVGLPLLAGIVLAGLMSGGLKIKD
jgi:hypothetical protein